MACRPAELLSIIHHLFLPRKLPQSSGALDEAGLNKAIPERFHNELLRLEKDASAGATGNEYEARLSGLTTQLRHAVGAWLTLQESGIIRSDQLQASIKQLRAGQLLPVYLREQNATIVIERQIECVNVYYFQASVESETVVSTTGDLVVSLPSGGVSIAANKLGLLESRALADQLADLCNKANFISVARSRKAGHEFAEIREVSQPNAVSEWLMAVICGDGSVMTSMVEVAKKIRDEVLWKSALKPFRRSEFYFSIKAVLQVWSVAAAGELQGTAFYKMLVLRVLLQVCKDWWAMAVQDGSSDGQRLLGMEQLSKLGRRSWKLEQLCDALGQNFGNLKAAIGNTIDWVSDFSAKVRKTLENGWQKTMDRSRPRVTLPKFERSDEDVKQLLETAMPQIKRHLSHRNSMFGASGSSRKQRRSLVRNRSTTEHPTLSWLESTSNEIDSDVYLMYVETWVRRLVHSASIFVRGELGVGDYYLWYRRYVETAKGRYVGDQISLSRMVLTATGLLTLIDRAVTAKYSLVKEYAMGIGTKQLSELTTNDNFEYVEELWRYIEGRNEQATYPNSLDEASNPASATAFGVRFAATNEEMQRKKNEIIRYIESNVRSKLAEVRQKKAECRRLEGEAAKLNCQYIQKLKNRRNPEWGYREVHSNRCQKCSLTKQANAITAGVYEKALPDDNVQRNAVVFELRIPDDLACLRDAVHFYQDHILRQSSESIFNRNYQIWHYYKYKALRPWSRTPRLASGYQMLVTPGSEIKSVIASHYRISGSLFDSDESFISPHGMKLVYSTEKSVLKYSADLTEFKAQFVFPVSGVYKPLKWTVEGTSHTENEVLCRQSECEAELSLREFRTFGCLRAGHRLQWHNLLCAIEQRTLDLNNRSVLSLVQQSIYQIGPIGPFGANTDMKVEAHESIKNVEFTKAVSDALGRLLNEVRDNWQQETAILAIVLIAGRLASLSGASREKELLLECRRVCLDLQEKLEQVIGVAITEQRSTSGSIEKLREKLVVLAAATIFTFGVNSEVVLFEQNAETLTTWLLSQARIRDNWALFNNNLFSDFLKPLRRRVLISGLLCEELLHGAMNEANLKPFIDKYWPDGKTGSIGNVWRFADWGYTVDFYSACSSGGWSTIELTISLDGEFLVDGLPASTLPPAIWNDSEYQRVFGGLHFEVRAAANSRGMVTTHAQRDCYNTFHTTDGGPLISERHKNETKSDKVKVLVPHKFFSHDLPERFSTKYSHWVDVQSEVVSFRPIRFDARNFTESTDYTLDLRTRHLVQAKTGAVLLDRNNRRFREFVSVFRRMELEQYIHVFEQKTGENGWRVVVELPRYGLSFEQTGPGEVRSIEFRGMRVAETQQIGTLIGVEQGLVLEAEKQDRPKLLLLPHAAVSLGRAKVELELDKLRSPTHFAYSIDERMGQVRAPPSDAALLYLAYLHAVTSSGLADALGGLTGAERAVEILQSGACFSCKPYDEESIKTLCEIESLSPKRDYYPPGKQVMETIEWPAGIEATQALDAYKVLVDNLVKDSQRTAFAFASDEQTRTVKATAKMELHWRALWRSAEQRSLLTEETMCMVKKPAETRVYGDSFSLGNPELSAVRSLVGHALAALGDGRATRPVGSSSSSFVEFFGRQSRLRGCGGPVGNIELSTHEALPTTAELKQEWLALAKRALECKSAEEQFSFLLYLSLFAYSCSSGSDGSVLAELLRLLSIAMNQSDLGKLRMPQYSDYDDAEEGEYSKAAVVKAIGLHLKSLATFRDTVDARLFKTEAEYNSHCTTQHRKLTAMDQEKVSEASFGKWWSGFNTVDASVLKSTSQVEPGVVASISSLFTKWRHNAELHAFFDTLNDTLRRRPCSREIEVDRSSWGPVSKLRFFKYRSCCNFDELALTEEDLSSVYLADVEALREQLPVCEKLNREELVSETLPLSFDAQSKPAAQRALLDDLKRSWAEYVKQKESERLRLDADLEGRLVSVGRALKQKGEEVFGRIVASLSPSSAAQRAVWSAGQWPRVVVSQVVACISERLNRLKLSSRSRSAVSLFVRVSVYEQYVNRCLRLLRGGEWTRVQLERELTNRPHTNWDVRENPEWLLFELENDVTIRAVQVEVAKRMLTPEEGENATMQLNMGEGKTVVIVPMVLVGLADGKRLGRLTVLKPLLKMNFNSLRHKLGCLLGRRAYVLPVSRDIEFGLSTVETMKNLLKECASRGGVWVTLAEHRNSLKLKCIEACRKSSETCLMDPYGYDDNDEKLAKASMEVLGWLKENARDVLDESDEILHTKFQLIYTLGCQEAVDGGRMRWHVAASVLKLAAKEIGEMAKFGDDFEYVENKQQKTGFPTIRLLSNNSSKASEELMERIVDDILDGKSEIKLAHVLTDEKRVLKQFILATSVTNEEFKQVEEIVEKDKLLLKTLRVIRGLLSHGVLSLVLTKRWRVNYGVNEELARPSSGVRQRQMAVPFRGKDMPSDRAEFGHPDVAIMYTVLSFYYSGLNETQLDEVFRRLENSTDREEQYSAWMHDMDLVDSEAWMREYRGVNLDDPEQKRSVYEKLRGHPEVIDYYLGAAVFAHEAKAFREKIVTSAWDLAERTRHPTTGFSGTNETKLLLPLSISQKDLAELEQTNGMMVANLLHASNDEYLGLEAEASGSAIVEILGGRSDVQVLLDVGGLILDMKNREVAMKWLEVFGRGNGSGSSGGNEGRDERVSAAVYFDEKDELQVVDRRGNTTRFDLSPYANSLERCVVYLDDAHTRGTDLRFPVGSRAAVTLGKGVTKDRLVQACMRMRLLGQGHSVMFVAAHDVDRAIRMGASDAPSTDRNDAEQGRRRTGSREVLNWALGNSGSQLEDGFVYWSAMGASYWHRAKALAAFEAGGSVEDVGRNFQEAEVYEVEKLYGLERAQVALPTLAEQRFETLHRKQPVVSAEMETETEAIREEVVGRCLTYVSDVSRFSEMLGEEQERELECEMEEEQQVERPRRLDAAKPFVREAVRRFVRTGKLQLEPTSDADAVVPLVNAFRRTSVERFLENNGWMSSLYVTRDFNEVLSARSNNYCSRVDEYLRTPRWIVEGEDKVLILSGSEANELWEDIQRFGVVSLRPFTETCRRNQVQLFNISGASVGGHSEHLSSWEEPMLRRLLAQLHVFGGSTYFGSVEDLNDWLAFLGVCPAPRSSDEQRLFDLGGIERNGFVKPDRRSMLESKRILNECRFMKNPQSMVQQLIEIRNYRAVHSSVDVLKVLSEHKRPIFRKEPPV